MQNLAGFQDKARRHVLMITNHGVHEWEVVPGLPDTGGQNVYVNQFTEALIKQGYRVTIVNRGGYPHLVTGQPQVGVRWHPSGHARIMYLEDGRSEFVRKEDMDKQLSVLAEDLHSKLETEGDRFDLIISHYWDAGKLGTLVNRNGQPGSKLAPHVWVPHSLGSLKKRNMDPATWGGLRIDERIGHEHRLLEAIDGAVATSSAIRDSFKSDYGVEPKYFLPPCIDVDRYHPMDAKHCQPIWELLSGCSGLSIDQLKGRKIITEISRTDKTKRKDVLIKAFAQVRRKLPEALLVVSIDDRAALYGELKALIEQEGVQNDVIMVGSIWDQLPMLYNVTSVYCTPSVMEGFGMSAQEAAATAKPVVASDLVPFVREYLLGDQPEEISVDAGDSSKNVLLGEGGVVVPADSEIGFAMALGRLLSDDALRTRMGQRAYQLTIPYFTWARRTKDLLSDLGFSPAVSEAGE